MSYAASVEQHRAWRSANESSCHTRKFISLPYSHILYVFITFFQNVIVACKNIQHSILLSETALGACKYKPKLEASVWMYLWPDTGYTAGSVKRGQLSLFQLPSVNPPLTQSGQAPRTPSSEHAELCKECYVRKNGRRV